MILRTDKRYITPVEADESGMCTIVRLPLPRHNLPLLEQIILNRHWSVSDKLIDVTNVIFAFMVSI